MQLARHSLLSWRENNTAVQVHRLVTLGTMEEKIDKMLEEKRRLASDVVGAGETWITELTDSQLADLVRLGDTIVDENTGSYRNGGD